MLDAVCRPLPRSFFPETVLAPPLLDVNSRFFRSDTSTTGVGSYDVGPRPRPPPVVNFKSSFDQTPVHFSRRTYHRIQTRLGSKLIRLSWWFRLSEYLME